MRLVPQGEIQNSMIWNGLFTLPCPKYNLNKLAALKLPILLTSALTIQVILVIKLDTYRIFS